MKYFIFMRERNPMAIAGRHYWYFAAEYDSFEEVQSLIEKNHLQEFRVLKGTELMWKIETEEKVTKTVIEKSRKLVDL